MNSVIRYFFMFTCLVIISTVPAWAQKKKPKAFPDPPKFLGDPPPAAVLQTPMPDATIDGCGVKLRWQAGRGTPANTTYRIYVWEVGKSRTSPGTYIEPAKGRPGINGTQYEVHLPANFLGKRLRWTVEACIPSLLQSKFNPGGNQICSVQQTAREFTWRLPPPQLGLQNPLNATVHLLFFYWTTVPDASYLVCVSKPGVSCPRPPQPVQNSNTLAKWGGRNQQGGGLAQIDISQFAGQTVHWTVAAVCRNSNNVYVYQKNVGIIHVPRK